MANSSTIALLRPKVEYLLDLIKEKLGVKLQWYAQAHPPNPWRRDVAKCGFLLNEGEISDEVKREARQLVEAEDWQWSRQCRPTPGMPDQRTEYIYLAPMKFVEPGIGFHVTHAKQVESILFKGLLPSIAERQTTSGRYDCEGNIYVCAKLGTPSDLGVKERYSAHFWRGELAEKNRLEDHDDANWHVLRVNLMGLDGAKIYEDLWSESGIIVGNVEKIPPSRIERAYPK